jgi:dCTP deaminase
MNSNPVDIMNKGAKMSVVCDHGIIDLIDKGLVDFSRSDTDYQTVIKQVNPNTLDLSLGRFIRWPMEAEGEVIFGREHRSELFWELREIDESKGILLRPGDIFLGSTREFLCMPSDVCGQVYTKSSLGRLFINHMMAGVIDAGFAGTITLELKNEGKHNVVIPYGARVVQIQLSRLEAVPDRDYSKRVNRYHGQIMPETAREERNGAAA